MTKLTPRPIDAFWSLPTEDLLARVHAAPEGLSIDEARARLERFGPNLLKSKKRSDTSTLLLAQFKTPIILILLLAAGLSFFLHNPIDALIILTIVIASGLLGFWQERGAAGAVEKLLAMIQIKAEVLRNGTSIEIPVENVVPGDRVILNAGDSVPADCRILSAKDLFVDEAALTGETYPAEKAAGVMPAETPLGRRTNALWMGTHVISGTAQAVAVHTGLKTEFGRVSERLKLRPPETEFERGVRRFGYLLMEVTLVLVIAIFAINVYLERPVLESFLFSLALAVGLTPQLLPAIISINLAHGAKNMAGKQVIVKRLASIENFGSMNVICFDKTGTLTEGVVQLQSALDVDGQPSEKVLHYAYLNAVYETGFRNPIDDAIRARRPFDPSGYRKLDEVPYDFLRKRLSILVSKDDATFMITKGALSNILEVCMTVEAGGGAVVDIAPHRHQIRQRFDAFGRQGLRALGVAYRPIEANISLSKDHEADMIFLGFLVFFDPPKPEIIGTIDRLKHLGVSMKIITGDNRRVSASIGRQVGLHDARILTGAELHQISDDALPAQVGGIDIFAEVEPNQKERIILALKKSGNVVGYMGDGINDASALHAADVGLSVDRAVDVAKEAADIVLLEKDLNVLVDGVREGRVTFANTLKYVFMATSANFGNMFSMAGASLFLSYLPLLPKQILLTNFLTDIPEMAIATDNVDPEMVEKPRRWDIRFIRNFMITFGLVSSVFDFLTFGALLLILHAAPVQFRTGWFMESVISASMIVLVVRTRKPFFKSLPGKNLLIATLVVVGLTFLLPFNGIGRMLGFDPLPGEFILLMGIIIVCYIIAAEVMKGFFYKRVKF
jgi:Mg2+-importing ATPase